MFTKSGLFAFITAIFVAQIGIAQAGGPIELVLHDDEVYGVRDIENGDYETGIERIRKRLRNGGQAHSVETPMLIDLCVAYTMSGQNDEATEYCDKAVAKGWYKGIAYNNRGALNFAKGNYTEAISDFQTALRHSGADKEAERNLQRAQIRLAQQQEQEADTYTVTVANKE